MTISKIPFPEEAKTNRKSASWIFGKKSMLKDLGVKIDKN